MTTGLRINARVILKSDWKGVREGETIELPRYTTAFVSSKQTADQKGDYITVKVENSVIVFSNRKCPLKWYAVLNANVP